MPANLSPSGNALYYGDNLHILRKYIRAESVDLVYIDPPFNSNADYNILFKERDGKQAAGQIKAFTDTWHWDVGTDRTYRELIKRADPIAQAMYAFYRLLGTSDMLAYLVMMTARLVEFHRVLKPTGSFYLHCDPSASHYLKIVLDALFGPTNFRNEIIWKRTSSHSDAKRWSPVVDSILFYTKSDKFTWNPQYLLHDGRYLQEKYRHDDGDGRRYQLHDMTSPKPRPNMMYEWKGYPSPPNGWRFSRETMARLDSENRIWYPGDVKKRPRIKRYLDENPGVVMGTVWTEIAPLNSQAREREGYPTQKPFALLKRIIEASSNPGDVVLDGFCGCGTAVAVAQERGRAWIGIDITHVAIEVIQNRLNRDYGAGTAPTPVGQPQTIADAQKLAESNPFAFEGWALSLVDADQPAKKKGADKGIDGRRVFGFSADGTPLEVLVSVKSGKVSSPQVRDLRGTVEREGAAVGLFITLQEPTRAMKDEVLIAGPCELPGFTDDCPRLQILTVAELFAGGQPRLPSPLAPVGPSSQAALSQAATVTPFQRPLPGAAVVDVSTPLAARPERLRAASGSRKQSAGD